MYQALRATLLLLFLFLGFQGHAQYAEWLRSERGGEGNGPFTVGKNTLQFEGGWDYTNQRREIRNLLMVLHNGQDVRFTDNQYDARFRLGIHERFEVSAGLNYLFTKADYGEIQTTRTYNFLNGANIAARANLYKGSGAVPAVGLEVTAAYECEVVKEEDIKFDAVLAFRSAFTDQFSLAGNIGFGDEFKLILTAGFQFTDRISAFLEYDPQFQEGSFLSSAYFSFSHAFLNAGGAYNISRDLQLSVGSSFLLNQAGIEKGFEIKDYLGIQLGLTGRINWRH